MGLVFVQTDVAANCGAIVACSGATLASATMPREAAEGGTPGTTGVGVTLPASSSNQAGIMFQTPTGVPGFTDWSAGDWVIRINHSATVLAGITWEDTYICRVDNVCGVVSTVGSLLAQAINVTALGVYTMTVAGGASSGADTDVPYIVCVFANSAGFVRTLTWTPDQNIDTPLTAPLVSDPLVTIALPGAATSVQQADLLELSKLP